MSIEATNAVWDVPMPTAGHKLVLLSIADRINGFGLAWPAVADIAHRAGLSERQAQRVLADLKRLGVLEVVRPAAQHHAPVYRVSLEQLRALPRGDAHVAPGVTPASPLPRGGAHDTPQREQVAPGVTPTSPRGDTGVAPGVTPTSPKPPGNHHEPPEKRGSTTSQVVTPSRRDARRPAPPPRARPRKATAGPSDALAGSDLALPSSGKNTNTTGINIATSTGKPNGSSEPAELLRLRAGELPEPPPEQELDHWCAELPAGNRGRFAVFAASRAAALNGRSWPAMLKTLQQLEARPTRWTLRRARS